MAHFHLLTILLIITGLFCAIHAIDKDRRHDRYRYSRGHYDNHRFSSESDEDSRDSAEMSDSHDLSDELDMRHRRRGGHHRRDHISRTISRDRQDRWKDGVVIIEPEEDGVQRGRYYVHDRAHNVNRGGRTEAGRRRHKNRDGIGRRLDRNNREAFAIADEPKAPTGAKFGHSVAEFLPDIGLLTPYLNGNIQIGPDISVTWNLGDLFTRKEDWWKGPNVCKTESMSESNSTNEDERDIFHHFVLSQTMCDNTDTAYKCTTTITINGQKKSFTTSYECCHGYQREEGQMGCSEALELTDLLTTAENLNLTQLTKAVKSVGLEDMLNEGNYTLFAPIDETFAEIIPEEMDIFDYYDNVEIVEVSPSAVDTAIAIEDVLAAHVVEGFKKSSGFDDEMLLDTANPNAKIRINKYEVPKRLITANCQPIISKDNLALNGVIHIVPKILNPVEDTLLDVISKNPALSTLKTVLAKTGLSTELGKMNGQYTLLAPTNEAFDKLDSKKLDKILGSKECLKNVLKQHLLPNVICSEILQGQVRSQNALNNYLRINRTKDNKVFVGSAQIVSVDIMGTNGVLHQIDEVLIPDEALDILDIAKKAGATEFLNLVSVAGLNKTLSIAENVTVFVPTNEAIEQLPQSTLSELQNNPQALAKVLKYHVVPKEVSGRQLCHAQELDTLDSKKKIVVKDYSSFPFSAKYVKTVECAPVKTLDMEACNGVIHLVDKVLMPPKGDVFDVLSQDNRFSTLVGLLKKSGLAEELQLSGPFTFFAPTNAAFNKIPRDVLDTLALDSEKERLKNLLKHHILRETLCCAGIFHTNFYWAPRERMLDGSNVLISRRDDPTVNGVSIELCDQTATNGVVHAIGDIIPEAVEKYAGSLRNRQRHGQRRRGRWHMGHIVGRVRDHVDRLADDLRHFEWEFEWPEWLRRAK